MCEIHEIGSSASLSSCRAGVTPWRGACSPPKAMSLVIRARIPHQINVKSPIPPKEPLSRAPPLNESRLERLVKLVPADVVSVYIPAIALGSLTTWRWYSLTITIAGTLLVPLLLLLDARSAKEPVPLVQYVVRTLAFVAWAFVISTPLGTIGLSPVVPALIGLVLPLIGERLVR